MIVNMYEHCYEGGLTVDGVDWEEIPNKKEILKQIIDIIPNNVLSDIMKTLVWEFPILEEDNNICEQCNNYNYNYTFKIEPINND